VEKEEKGREGQALSLFLFFMTIEGAEKMNGREKS